MGNKTKTKLFFLLLPLSVGGVSALLGGRSMERYDALSQPPLAPPGWAFPVVWTVLFVLMGIASWQVARTRLQRPQVREALTLYGFQLGVNLLWTLWFFRLELYLFSFLWLCLLWVLVWLTRKAFRQVYPPAGDLLVPYLIWVAFAGYLNLGVYFLN